MKSSQQGVKMAKWTAEIFFLIIFINCMFRFGGVDLWPSVMKKFGISVLVSEKQKPIQCIRGGEITQRSHMQPFTPPQKIKKHDCNEVDST